MPPVYVVIGTACAAVITAGVAFVKVRRMTKDHQHHAGGQRKVLSSPSSGRTEEILEQVHR